MRCEIAKLFGVLPITLKSLPLSEFQIMLRYYLKQRDDVESAQDHNAAGPTDGVVIG